MNTLEITDLVINPVKKPNSKLKAVCHVTFNSTLIVTGIRIENKEHGLTVTFPKVTLSISDALVKNKVISRILSAYIINHTELADR